MALVAPRQEAPLRGIVLRDDGESLVVEPTVAEVRQVARDRRRFEQGAQVEMRRATVTVFPFAVWDGATTVGTSAEDPVAVDEPGVLDPGDYLYDAAGRRVALIEDVEMYNDRLDVTSFGDVTQQFARGALHVRIRARGVPGVRVEHLRGRV